MAMDETTKKILFRSTWTPAKLRDVRERLGLTQKEIGELIGVSTTTISHTELGYNMHGPTFFAYATVLERYYAYTMGFMPSYREVGTANYITLQV